MRGIIIYKGKYGATEQYAKWIAEELAIPLYKESDNIDELPGVLENSDFVIIGSSVYMGKLQMAKWIRRNTHKLSGKKIFLFVVCATAPDQTDKLNLIVKNNVPEILIGNTRPFFLHGRMIMSKLSFMDRFFLKMGASLEKDPIERKTMLTDFDAVKKENIAPVVNQLAGQV